MGPDCRIDADMEVVITLKIWDDRDRRAKFYLDRVPLVSSLEGVATGERDIRWSASLSFQLWRESRLESETFRGASLSPFSSGWEAFPTFGTGIHVSELADRLP